MWIRTPRIFVVDDDRVIADTLQEVFSSRGCEAFAMYSAGSALQVALEQTPDLLVADVFLNPDTINGVDLAIYWERLFPQCKVLLMSGHPAAVTVLARAEAAGRRFRLLQKPVHPTELLAAAFDLLAGLLKQRA
jgi:DNA-binding NtrC family response regulator